MNARLAVAFAVSLVLLGGPVLRADDEPPKEIKGNLAENDPADPILKMPHKVHTVNLEAGKGYVIDLESSDFDALLRVEDPSGETIAIDDDGGEDLNSRVTVAAVQKGAFKIIASSLMGAGAYTVKLRPIAVTLAERGKLAEAVATHKVKLSPGTLYIVNVVSKNFDTFVRIEDSKGEKVAENDDVGFDLLHSKIALTPSREDTYKIMVTSFDGDGRGAYDITVVAGASAAVPIPFAGASVKAKLDANEPRDSFQRKSPHKLYLMKMKAGMIYTINLDSDDFDPFLRLESPSGDPLQFDDDGGGGLNSRILYSPQADGEFRIVATSLGGGTGAFNLSVQTAKAGATVLNEKGELKQQTTTHRLKVADGKMYVIDLSSSAFDPLLKLNDANGKEIAEDDDGGGELNSRIVFTANGDGVYEIVVTSFDDDGRGVYNLTVREAAKQ